METVQGCAEEEMAEAVQAVEYVIAPHHGDKHGVPNPPRRYPLLRVGAVDLKQGEVTITSQVPIIFNRDRLRDMK